ncbi:MAG: hypothetical protein U1F43_36300, partial [Myxococcota bacterium]
QVTLMRDQSFPRGTSGPRLVLKAGASGQASVVKSALERFQGQATVSVCDAAGPLVDVSARVAYDVAHDRLDELVGEATLLRPIAIAVGGVADAVEIGALTGEARITGGELAEVHGALDVRLPHLGDGVSVSLDGGWRRGADGAADVYWGSGTLALDLADDANGRSLHGQVQVDVGEDGHWQVNGKLDWKLTPDIGGKVGVQMDEKLDPVIDIDLNLSNLTILPAQTLFEKHLDLVPRMPFPAGPFIFASFGLTAGLGLKTRALTGGVAIAVAAWRPFSDASTVPTFDAAMQLDWGVDVHLGVAPFLEVGFGLPELAAIAAGIEAELALDVPLAFKPAAHLHGGPDGLRGELDVSLDVAPALALNVTPYLTGQVICFDLGKAKLDPFAVDLGSPLHFAWGTKYTFGDQTGQSAIAPGAVRGEGGNRSETRARHAKPMQFPTAASTPAHHPGAPALDGEPGQAQTGGAGGLGDGLGPVKDVMEVVRLVGVAARAIQVYTAIPNPVSVAMGGAEAIEKLYRDKLAAWQDLARAGRTLLKMAAGKDLGAVLDGIPLWVRNIIDAPDGQAPGPFDAWDSEDEVAGKFIDDKIYLVMSLARRVQLGKALLSGGCVDADEGHVMVLLEDAARRGELDAFVKGVGGVATLLDKLDGAEDGKTRVLLERAGIAIPEVNP